VCLCLILGVPAADSRFHVVRSLQFFVCRARVVVYCGCRLISSYIPGVQEPLLVPRFRSVLLSVERVFSKKIVYIPSQATTAFKNYCVALARPPLGLNDYSLAPPTRG
jgi:hypothetical protein